jgi:phage-related protein
LYKDLEKSGTYPPRLLQAVKENRKILFFPSKPSVVAGRERFAWLELDPNTYEVLSVLDNGCHGGSAEFSMLTTTLGEDTREFVKGTWLGINMSVWSVGTIALKTSDKAQIFTEGKALALKIGAILAEFQDNVAKAKEYNDKINELKEKAADMMEQVDSGGDTDYGAKIKESLTKVFDQLPRVKLCGVDVNAKLKEGFRGFSNGYDTAVDVYFHLFGGSKRHIEVERGGSD